MPTNSEGDERRDHGLLGPWGAVLRDVRTLAADLTTASSEMARQLPLPDLHTIVQLAELGDASRARVEDALLRELKARLGALDSPQAQRHQHASAGTLTPGQLLDQLLEASIETSTQDSRDELYCSLLRQLVPDEARILAALSDGTAYPLLHVQSRSGNVGTALSNISTVGRAAGVALPDAVSTYVAHLRTLGLAEEGPADDSLSVQYDILLGEPLVRRAEQEVRGAGLLGAKIVRRTLRISTLGRQLWLACRPEPEPEVVDVTAPVLDTEATPEATAESHNVNGRRYSAYRPGAVPGTHGVNGHR